MLQNAYADDILIYIRDDVYLDYLEFLDGRDVLDINHFSGKNIRRDVVDMIIAQQALKLGGFEHTFRYAPGKINFRNTKMLQLGKLLISFDSYWLSDAKALNDKAFISAPVIRHGEYIAGIYTSPLNSDVLAITDIEHLKQFTSVSTPKWKTDWQTLKALPLKKLVREDEWLSMARMVHLQWIDFLLMPFNSTPDQSFSIDKITLIPVKNIGIELRDSRHFVISTQHPYGKKAFQAIEIGLKKLRHNNSIVKAYTEAGFFIDRSSLKIINK
ncbi:hypothetical protein CJF42_22075 [Pseudoalteromonas sp. NBT06-2]|nr:hypothetical protein CJF42_22075 [Pseudoalteromonas sp. NBT06-2]